MRDVLRAACVAWRPLIACGVAVGISACGGTYAGTATATVHTVSFDGNLTSAPASRTIHLKAGEAVKWWVRPDRGNTSWLTLAIAAPASAASAPAFAAYGVASGSSAESYGEFFSDYAGSAGTEPSAESAGSTFSDPLNGQTYDYGLPLVETNYYYPSVRLGVGAFTAYGRGWGAAQRSGDWMFFVAPATSNYDLLIGGTGAFVGQYATHLTSVSTHPSSAKPFSSAAPPATYTAATWVAICRQQVPFIFASGFFPSQGFFSDYSTSGISSEAATPSVNFGPQTIEPRVKSDLDRAVTELNKSAS